MSRKILTLCLLRKEREVPIIKIISKKLFPTSNLMINRHLYKKFKEKMTEKERKSQVTLWSGKMWHHFKELSKRTYLHKNQVLYYVRPSSARKRKKEKRRKQILGYKLSRNKWVSLLSNESCLTSNMWNLNGNVDKGNVMQNFSD